MYRYRFYSKPVYTVILCPLLYKYKYNGSVSSTSEVEILVY